MAKTIAIDFDGVIHKYSKGWHDGSCYDQEVDGVFKAIEAFMESHTVFIFSTRSPRQIRSWLREHTMDPGFGDNPMDPQEWTWPRYDFTFEIIPFWVKFWNKKKVLGITQRKLPAMVYIDDRAMRFEGDWKDIMTQLKTFKTYQEV